MRTKISKDIEREIIDLYLNEKMGSVELGKKYGIHFSTVIDILIRNGIPRRSRSESRKLSRFHNLIPQPKINNMIELYLNGKNSVKSISKTLDISYGITLKILKKHNIPIKNPNSFVRYEHPKTNLIIKLYESGLGMRPISKKLKISYGSVRKVLAKKHLIRTEMKNKGRKNCPYKPISKEHRDKYYITKTGMKYDEYMKVIPKLKKYQKKVRYYTNKQNLKSLPNYEKRGVYMGKSSNTYHLDHKYSILEGFKNNINPELIGNIHNLEMIPGYENRKKYKNCSITIELLLELTQNKISLMWNE